MAVKPESTFIRSVNKHVPFDVYRMKNHNAYVAGIPDVWYSGRTQSLWVEYKYVPVTRPTAPVVPNLSVQQLRWILDRRKEGRNVWVIVGSKLGGVIFKSLKHIEHGMSAKSYMKKLKLRRELAEAIFDFCHKEPQ